MAEDAEGEAEVEEGVGWALRAEAAAKVEEKDGLRGGGGMTKGQGQGMTKEDEQQGRGMI